MSNLFAPTAPEQVAQAVKPQPGAPLPDIATPVSGRPVPVLANLFDFHGGIGDFNQRLQAVVDAHVQQLGYQPSPATALHLAVSTPPEQASNLFAPAAPLAGTPAPGAVQQPAVMTSPELLRSVLAYAHNGLLDEWYRLHGDQAQAMLRDPKYGVQMRAAIAQANDLETFAERQRAGGGIGDVAKGLALAVPKAGWWAAKTTNALADDTGAATQWLATGGTHGSIAFPKLTAAAPAVAQVVKGLVYSPVGIAQTVKAIALDAKDAATGDFSFKHTIKLGKQIGQAFVQDLSDPQHRAGYLALDLFGIASLGVGSVTRLSAASAAAREGEGAAAAARALVAPHPLRTTTLSKNGFEEQISLASSPMSAWLQEFTPIIGTRAAQARLSGEAGPVATTLTGEPIESFRLVPDAVQNWADRFFTEGRIGRAGNIRRITDYKAAMGLKADLDHATGSSAAASRIGELVNRIAGRNLFDGLSRGEVKATQALSWDDPNPLAAEERFHQSMIEQDIGNKAAHQEQIANLGLARKALENPSERFEKTLDAMARVTAATQAMRIKMGLGIETAERRIARAGSVLREEDLVQTPEGKTAVRTPGTGSYYDLTHALDQSQTVLRGEQRKLATLEARLAKPTQTGKPIARPKLQARVEKQRSTVDEWSRQVAADQARLKADGPKVTPLERQSETSWYTPIVPKSRPRPRNLAETPYQRALSMFGFGPPTGTNLFSHEMTGDALRAGDIRIDAHHLAGEGYARTVRAMQTIDEWKKAWDNGSPLPSSPHDVPVRDVREIPDELRKAVSQFYDGQLDSATAEGLPPEVHKWLFPKALEENDHVRYIDPRLLGNAAKPTLPAGPIAKFAEKVNNLMRPWILYGPKYALNKLGNDAMLVLDQGPWKAGQNLARAHSAEDHLSPEALAKLKSLTGATRSESYVNPRSSRISQGLADWWSRMTDNEERMASWLYYADRKGYKTWDQLEQLLLHDDSDATARSDFLDVSKRSDDALVAFDRMSPWEKATLRHYLFVYPWQRGATIWSFRTVFEHPAKTAVLATLGQEAYQNDDWLKTAVQWVRRTGYIPLWWGPDGNPVVIDPTSINTFSTLAQGLETLKAGIEGDKYASTGDLFGPPGQFLMHGVLGVDQNGNTYPGSQWLGSAEEALNILPLVAAFERNQKGSGKQLKPFDITNRASLNAQLNSAIKQTALSPGFLAGFGNIFAGGFTPRELNLTAVAARYWRDATPAQRHAHELDLLNRALNMQADFLQRPVSPGVRAAVKDGAQLSWLATQEAKNLGRTPTEKEQLLLAINYLKNAGRISDFAVADTLAATAKALETVPDIRAMRAKLLVTYGHLTELHQWDSDVRLVASLRDPVNFNSRVAGLFTVGLADQKLYHLTEPQREAYGRGYATYLDDRRKLQKEIRVGSADKSELAVFDDQHDKPVNGLPSYPRFSFSEGTAAEQERRVASLASKSWGGLSRADKAALGRDVSPTLSEAWGRYNATLAAVRERDGNVAKNQKVAVAKEANREFPGFMQDWLYAQQSRAARLERSPLVKQFPATFRQVLSDAAKVGAVITRDGHRDYYTKAWRHYLDTVVKPWLQTDRDGQQVAQVIAPFGKTFLEGLVTSG
jgi:hypothetical protein